MTSNLRADEFNYIRDLLRRYSGMVLEADKQYLVELRLNPLLRKMGLRNISALIQELRTGADSSLQQVVMDALLNNETLFFRDITPFQTLKEHILPELQEKYKSTRRINIWSAACSHGQEPYSIAMLIKENFPELVSHWKINIMATDLSQKALNKAQEAIYKQLEINRGLPANYLIKYFVQIGANWELRAEIKNMVNFRELNLLQFTPTFEKQDVIFLRNVLIYFDVEDKKKILSKIRQQLKPDGYLFLGSGETTISLDSNFARQQIGRAEVYRHKQ